MKSLLLGGLLGCLWSGACASVEVTAQAGFTQVSVGGDIALAQGSSGAGVTAEQDVGSAFGLGDQQGSPYARARFDFDGPVVTASGFLFRERGQGVLDAAFGGISAATPVETVLDFGCAKLTGAYDLDLGPVVVSPGIAVDVFDLDFQVSDTTFGNREEIDEIVAVPMLFVRAAAAVGALGFVGEVGYVGTPEVGDSKGSLLDAEAMVEWSLAPRGELFAGYRFLDIDANGDTGSESFVLDLHVGGWFVGGGIHF